ncbi:DUF2057 family protein [Moraxella sp. ZY210820]|uniref:DUF2057 family protein n=1 Tax=unclassified Moraxella TaxID=2685852 RepID=UPI00272F5CF9|nr:DUF2057 family protein [Moraxella sp. ZY210820]WLF82992.1 DUF2057 domain-containing protein [Moraxella sp. ZY210820]
MKNFLIASCLAITSSYALADVHIISPEELQIVVINDQQIKSSFIKANQNKFTVRGNQQHQIYIRYVQFFNLPLNDEHEIIKSDIGIFNTPILQDGQTYRLAIAQQPKTLEDAKQFAQKPSVILYNAQNQIIAQQTFEQTSKTWFSGLTLNRSYDLTKKKPAIMPMPTAPSLTNTTPTHYNSLIEQWNKASVDERQAFIQWLNQQSK